MVIRAACAIWHAGGMQKEMGEGGAASSALLLSSCRSFHHSSSGYCTYPMSIPVKKRVHQHIEDTKGADWGWLGKATQAVLQCSSSMLVGGVWAHPRVVSILKVLEWWSSGKERTMGMAISVQRSPFEPFPCQKLWTNLWIAPAKSCESAFPPPKSCELMAKSDCEKWPSWGGAVPILAGDSAIHGSRLEFEFPSIHTSSPETLVT